MQLQEVWEDLTIWRPGKSHENSHRREAMQLQEVWEDLTIWRPGKSRELTQEGSHSVVRSVARPSLKVAATQST